jgi:hypothetical protein
MIKAIVELRDLGKLAERAGDVFDWLPRHKASVIGAMIET